MCPHNRAPLSILIYIWRWYARPQIFINSFSSYRNGIRLRMYFKRFIRKILRKLQINLQLISETFLISLLLIAIKISESFLVTTKWLYQTIALIYYLWFMCYKKTKATIMILFFTDESVRIWFFIDSIDFSFGLLFLLRIVVYTI